ncbi:MAG: SPOCS domain-containing protein [Romboutsia sp.]|uniref:SPOCS domain-containing protein n=1 Tax=Romboutsia sp. TaxID=1965302 RepID=UPI003F38C793
MKNCCSYKVIGINDVSKFNFNSTKIEALNWKEISIVELVSIPNSKVSIKEINEVYIQVDLNDLKLIETPYYRKDYEVALLDADGNVVYTNGKVQSCSCCNVFKLEPNEEGTCLSGRKLIISGTLEQKIVYTGDVESQPVHFFKNKFPFSTYITIYAKFKDTTLLSTDIVVIDPQDDTKTIIIDGYLYDDNNSIEVDLCENFCVDVCVEDIFVKVLNSETIFKSVTLFLSSKPCANCP